MNQVRKNRDSHIHRVPGRCAPAAASKEAARACAPPGEKEEVAFRNEEAEYVPRGEGGLQETGGVCVALTGQACRKARGPQPLGGWSQWESALIPTNLSQREARWSLQEKNDA